MSFQGKEQVIDTNHVRAAFSEHKTLTPLPGSSGQKYVFMVDSDPPSVLKIFKTNTITNDDRTEREIRAVAALTSDYVPKVLEHGTREIGGQEYTFLREQAIDGKTYREILLAKPKQAPAFVLDLGEALISACVDFENAALVHRDIKPENLMLDADGKVWVIDFGIVRFLNLESLTATAERVGPATLGYGALEQIKNKKGEIDCRADLFAIGVVLYESIRGYNPYLFGKSNVYEILRHLETSDLPRLTIQGDARGDFSDFLAAMTSRYRSRRPRTALEAQVWLRDVRKSIGA